MTRYEVAFFAIRLRMKRQISFYPKAGSILLRTTIQPPQAFSGLIKLGINWITQHSTIYLNGMNLIIFSRPDWAHLSVCPNRTAELFISNFKENLYLRISVFYHHFTLLSSI
jgi:hypothetical protein